MALSRSNVDLRITEDNIGDWTWGGGFAPGSSRGTDYEYHHSDDDTSYVRSYIGLSNYTVRSPTVDLSDFTVQRIVPLGQEKRTAADTYTRNRYLVSDDNGVTWKKYASGSWSAVNIANISSEGMLGEELAAAGLPDERSLIKIAAYVISGTDFDGFTIVTGSYGGGYEIIDDFRGNAQLFFEDVLEDFQRVDAINPHLAVKRGSFVVTEPFTSGAWFSETNGLIFRGSGPNTSLPRTTGDTPLWLDVKGAIQNRGFSLQVNGTIDESYWLFRILVADDPGELGFCPEPGQGSSSDLVYKAWDGSTWSTVDVYDFWAGSAEGMTIEQFNEADWSALTLEGQLCCAVYAQRLAYPDNEEDDWWIAGLVGYAVPYSHSNPYTPPAASEGLSGTEKPQVGSAMVGHVGGLISEFSKERGHRRMPSHITTRGVVSSYSAYGEDADSGVFNPYIIATTADWDGNAAYYGPLHRSALGPMTFDRWWPTSDAWTGAIIQMVSGTSAGQWNIVLSRPSNNSRKFHLLYEFATAPVAGDKFFFGQIFYVVFGEQSHRSPMGDFIDITKVKIPRMHWRVGRPELRLEYYRSGYEFPVSNPVYPYTTSIPWQEWDDEAFHERGAFADAPKDSSGVGVTGREVSVAMIVPLDKNDFTLDELCYIVKEDVPTVP